MVARHNSVQDISVRLRHTKTSDMSELDFSAHRQTLMAWFRASAVVAKRVMVESCQLVPDYARYVSSILKMDIKFQLYSKPVRDFSQYLLTGM